MTAIADINRAKLALLLNNSATDTKNARLSNVESLKDGTMCMYIHVNGLMVYATVDADEVQSLVEEMVQDN